MGWGEIFAGMRWDGEKPTRDGLGNSRLGNLGKFWTQKMEKCWELMEWFEKTEHGEQNDGG